MNRILAAFALLLLPAAASAQVAADELYREGVAARHAGQPERAVQLLERAAAAQPENADVQLEYGLALLAAGRLDAAESALRRALALAPDYADVRLGLARVAQRRGDLTGARQALAPIAPGNAEAEALVRLLSAAPVESRWQVDIDGSYSFLGRGRRDWQEGSFRLGHQVDPATLVAVKLEPARRFGRTDVYREARVERRFSNRALGYLLFGATPSADFRPRWQIGAGGWLRLSEGPRATVLTLDAQHSRFRVGDVQILNPGIEQYVANGRAWLTGRWINVFDESGRHRMGWLGRGDWLASDRLRLFAGAADAPETSEGVVVETFTLFGGISYQASERTSLRLSAAREDRHSGLGRTQLHMGVGFRF